MPASFTNSLFGGKTEVLGGTLQLRLARQSFSSTNLANMDTPGFRAKHLDFEEVLSRKLNTGQSRALDARQTNANHIPNRSINKAFSQASNAIKDAPYGENEYGEDVLDIDKEMTLLTKNQLIYNTTVQMLAKSFEGLKYAISEGSGG